MAKSPGKSAMSNAVPAPDAKWQAEDDQRTLTRAAEVVADRARLKAAMGLLTKQTQATAKLVDVLAARRLPPAKG